MEERAEKPLGKRAYGSIPHLPTSRRGPADKGVNEGQAAICLSKARPGDTIIVTEKLDGSNVAVANIDGDLIPLTRAGYKVAASPYEQHHLFGEWVASNIDLFGFLRPGERVNGEWLALAHGTRYELTHAPFVAFDMMRGESRLLWDDITARCASAGLVVAHELHRGTPISLGAVQALIETSHHGALEPVEGAVWRVERKGKVDFMAKWVRGDKIDGKYLEDIGGCEPIWHWRPGQAA